MHKSDEWRLDYIARVEGEGGLDLILSDGKMESARLRIFEPPRFFEGFLQGRRFSEVPDITARICGICPVSYQMAACTAIEKAFDFAPSPQTRKLRRLFSWAEIMQSHVLHIYMLAAPDYLGVEGVPELASEYPELVERALRLRGVAAAITNAVGGREVHPITPKVTGFYDLPSAAEIEDMAEHLRNGLDDAIATLRLTGDLQLPTLDRNIDYLSLSHKDMYALNEGDVKTLSGLSFPVEEFLSHVIEEQMPYSNALQCRLKNSGSYQTGPLARVNINHQQLSSTTKDLLNEMGLEFPSQNPFDGIIARAAEVLTGIEECLEILDDFSPEPENVEVIPRAGEGFGISEAPRGSLFHRYVLDDAGFVKKAQLIPPTSQNLARIEDDLLMYAPQLLEQDRDKLSLACEVLIRSYDPCISCATHFLKVKVVKE